MPVVQALVNRHLLAPAHSLAGNGRLAKLVPPINERSLEPSAPVEEVLKVRAVKGTLQDRAHS